MPKIDIKDFEKLTIYNQHRKKSPEDLNKKDENKYDCDPNGGSCAPFDDCMPVIGCIPNECGPDEGIDKIESTEDNSSSTPRP